VRKIQVLCDSFGVVDVIERTAAMLRGAVALKFREAALIPELHGEPDDGMALLLQKRGDGGGIDATRHAHGNEAALSFRALRESVELGSGVHGDNFILPNLAASRKKRREISRFARNDVKMDRD
jgi:hypothetical protein